jgi:Recombination endonuclease VII
VSSRVCYRGCRCEPCAARRAYGTHKQREYRQRNPLQTKKNNLSVYGLSYEDWQLMVTAQDNKCAACSKPELGHNQHGLMALAVDHDHTTGKVRALLCHRCNRALGLLGDDPARVEALARYRRQY